MKSLVGLLWPRLMVALLLSLSLSLSSSVVVQQVPADQPGRRPQQLGRGRPSPAAQAARTQRSLLPEVHCTDRIYRRNIHSLYTCYSLHSLGLVRRTSGSFLLVELSRSSSRASHNPRTLLTVSYARRSIILCSLGHMQSPPVDVLGRCVLCALCRSLMTR